MLRESSETSNMPQVRERKKDIKRICKELGIDYSSDGLVQRKVFFIKDVLTQELVQEESREVIQEVTRELVEHTMSLQHHAIVPIGK